MPKKTSRGRYNWARPAALRGGRPLVDEVVKVGRGREEKVGTGAPGKASELVVAVRSKFKIYQRIARPKRYT